MRHEAAVHSGRTKNVSDVTVRIEITVSGDARDFSASAKTDGDGYRVADGLVGSLRNEAGDWLRSHRLNAAAGGAS